MTDHRLNSPWLPDWRSFEYEADNLSGRSRDVVREAIRRKSQEWEQKHQAAYSERFKKNRDARRERVFDACDELTKQLKKIRAELDWGRITPAQAKAALRDINARHGQIMQVHDTLVEEDAEIEEFAALTPDDYQREFTERYPVLRTTQPSLLDFANQIPAPRREPRPDEFVGARATGDNAPSADDLTY
ncbi:hypothetical protein [Micromonospora sp. NPDC093244]|uniref:hypothetical protein n=1 Tax=Micromonospora sp. NPDC093244 TaxID=3155071 RepID=UPI003440365A